jgi:Na+/H+ antiporter NhaD/arsenite permease-like protein
MLIVFIIGYIAIALEHFLHINKAATALLLGVVCWIVLVFSHTGLDINTLLQYNLAKCSEILFFLLGAMTIVELIDAHHGFDIITDKIKVSSTIKMLWLIAGITFFLSAILDNLTTTIVMITIVRKLIAQNSLRIYFAGIIVIAANAGGAWSPIGDVTTTMLWIGKQITEFAVIKQVFLPSVVAIIIPLAISSLVIKEKIEVPTQPVKRTNTILPRNQQILVLCTGLIVFLMIPFFKTYTSLPPYMGMLFGLGILWLLTELLHRTKPEEHKELVTVHYIIQKIDTASILFFFGILLSIGALESGGYLHHIAQQLQSVLPNQHTQVFCLGLLSSIIDNVPLVAATQGMYPLTQIPTDSFFWHYLAFCTGTGGSILVIGSAAGVAAMGMLPIQFLPYIKRTGILALLGYAAGALVCLALG